MSPVTAGWSFLQGSFFRVMSSREAFSFLGVVFFLLGVLPCAYVYSITGSTLGLYHFMLPGIFPAACLVFSTILFAFGASLAQAVKQAVAKYTGKPLTLRVPLPFFVLSYAAAVTLILLYNSGPMGPSTFTLMVTLPCAFAAVTELVANFFLRFVFPVGEKRWAEMMTAAPANQIAPAAAVLPLDQAASASAQPTVAAVSPLAAAAASAAATTEPAPSAAVAGADSASMITVGANAIRLSEVVLIEAQGNYVRVETQNRSLTERETFSNIMSQVADEIGVQVHRSRWVAFDAISALLREDGAYFIQTTTDERVAIARPRKREVLKELTARGVRVEAMKAEPAGRKPIKSAEILGDTKHAATVRYPQSPTHGPQHLARG